MHVKILDEALQRLYGLGMIPVLTEQSPKWKKALVVQGRSLTWLAQRTDHPLNMVYKYSIGERTPPSEWLTKAAAVLGLPDAA